jgi:hypothetical protein
VTQKQLANLRPFQPGNPGGPGRPAGSRQAFSAGFLTDLAQVWQQHGKDTIAHTAKTQPAVFFATCARLIGPEVKLTIEQSQPALDATDIEILRAIKEAIPNADKMSPQQVLQHVLDAVQSFESKVILALPKPGSDK